ncbi:hypothetical protein GCM10020229_28660 [Kitasatospora albolonga]
MSSPRLTLDRLRALVADGSVDTVVLALTDMQGRLQGKRIAAGHFLDEVVGHAAEGCGYLLAVDVDMNTVDGYEVSSWETGYGDFVMRPDFDTLRMVPWHPATAMVQCDVLQQDGTPVPVSPRQVLRRQLERLAGYGWQAYAGTELEFIVFKDSYEQAWDKGYSGLTPVNQYNVDYSILGTSRIEPLLRRLRNEMAGAGLTVESAKGECNLGQHEIAFKYGPRADHLRRPRGLQDRCQGDRGPGRLQPHLHGQVRPAGGQLLPRPPEPARRARRPGLRGRRTARLLPDHGALPGRTAGLPGRVRPAAGADGQLLQALRPRQLRPHRHRLGAGTTGPARCGWSATAPRCGSRTGCPAGTSIPTWRWPR